MSPKLKKKIEKFNALNERWGRLCTNIDIEGENICNGGVNLDPNTRNDNIPFLIMLWRSLVLEMKCNRIYKIHFRELFG